MDINFEKILGLVAGAAQSQRVFTSAYEAGKDVAINGSNVANSHFCWFSSRESANEWERGKREASINGTEAL